MSVYYGRNLALVGKEAIRFIYKITVYCLLWLLYCALLIFDYLPCRYNLFSHYFGWIFHDIYGCLENVFELNEGNIYRCCWRRSLKRQVEPDDVAFVISRQFTFVLIFIIWWFALKFVVIPRLKNILIVFRYFMQNFRIAGKVR